MLLGGILQFIKEKMKTADPSLLQVLASVDKLLSESEDGHNLQKIQQALIYLQKVKIDAGFLSSAKSFGAILYEKKRPIVNMSEIPASLRNDLPDMPKKSLPSDSEEVLGRLYVSIMRHYKKPIWSYTYPLEETGQVMNDAVGVWQARLMELLSDKRAYRDFKRHIHLAGMSSLMATDDQISKAIESLVGKATGYADEDKSKLVEWLKNNGGQDNNRFLDFMFLQHHFSEKDYMLLKSKAVEQNWEVENGKLHFNYDVLISSVGSPPADEYFYATKSGGTVVGKDPEMMNKELEVAEKEIPPYLMRVTAKLELEVDEDKKIKPKIIALTVSSHTDKLLSPERLFSKEQEYDISTRPKM